MITTITVTVNRVIYRKPDSNWHILKTDQGDAKGVVNFEVKEGDMLRMEGVWKTSQFNGKNEFIFKVALLSVPEDPEALLHYACEITKGIGPATEQEIWARYREEWQEHPDLDDIHGINESKRFNWQDTLKRLTEKAAQTQAIAFLMGKGTTLNMASLAWDKWQGDTIGKVIANPFVLADLPRYGFTAVDEGIRQAFGISDDDPRRLQAAIMYCVDKLAIQTGTAVGRQELIDELIKIMPVEDLKFDAAIKELVDTEKICRLPQGSFALSIDYDQEKRIWNRFNLMKAS